jgi:Zn-dependent protease/predicted transcriptional regulator
MRSGIRVGRIFGIDINIDWSWVIIFALVAWSLSSSFSAAHVNWGLGESWFYAIIAALVFFASVLAHEIAHSLIARTRGVPVKNITLFLFGGVSNIQREPPSAMAEFLIAIVGPLTSFAAGIVFLALAWLTKPGSLVSITNPAAAFSQLNPVTTLLFWLGSINILVGTFNLIPGYPLDGGRVLRSILWGISHNLREATRWASYIGQGVAWLMILAGIAMVFGVNIPLLGSGFINGLWMAFIGWFLSSAAQHSYQQTIMQDILKNVDVKRLMDTQPKTVAPELCVDDLVNNYMLRSGEDAFPVLMGDTLMGVVTVANVRALSRQDWGSRTVGDIMTPYDRLPLVHPEEEATNAMNILSSKRLKELFVVQGRELLGVLRRKDIIRWLQMNSDSSGSRL